MANVDFSKVNVEGGFWGERQVLNLDKTLPAIKASYLKTGRFDALKCNYRKWKFWRKAPHIFFDSDVAKFIEACAYHLQKERNVEMEAFIDYELIDNIAKNQRKDGYYNSHFLVKRKNKVFTYRSEHELYCLGHLIEAAIAYHNATGKDRLLNVCKKYCDYVEKRFLIDKDTAFTCPGHPEIELALVKLYRHTGDKKYLEMAKYFIYVRGTEEGDKGLNKKAQYNPWCDGYYAQDFVPIKEQRTAEGHAVRACYLYSGAADIALEERDDELHDALKAIYQNITDRRMYITGGIGAKAQTEAFDNDFILPNDKAFTESCAAISLIMFARRLQELERKACYADLIERVLYNGFLSSTSLSGDRFFYENPLEIDFSKRKKDSGRYPIAERQKDFECSCCPPNIARQVASVGGLVYATEGDALYVDQYVASTAEVDMLNKTVGISLVTDFPKSGSLNIKITNGTGVLLKVRIPAWATSIKVGARYSELNDYIAIDVNADEYDVDILFGMEVKVKDADPRVITNQGTAYVEYGPFVYCAEACDNGKLTEYTLNSLSEKAALIEWAKEYNAYKVSLPAVRGEDKAILNMIPYYCFNNRGANDMYVYFNKN
ncbi:MAG: glycoside hydrolase family 127 protein [Clostridia bacterium]|nr:glycoside hydrolase family 127 protein [Clostridia bacterium]